MPNTRAEYRYTDSSNNKEYAEVVLAGDLSDAARALLATVMDGDGFFLPEQVGLEVIYSQNSSHYDDDHIWHQLTDVTSTEQAVTQENLTAAEWASQFAGIVWDEPTAIARLEAWMASSPHGPVDDEYPDGNDEACEYR